LDTIGAVLINADGQTVLTHYRHGRKPDKTMHVYSVTKSVLSALIGIALDEKLIKNLDSPLGELLPRHRAHMTGDMARVTPTDSEDVFALVSDVILTRFH
jgi:CubicO group peptidase (beta-lactamase class C family)